MNEANAHSVGGRNPIDANGASVNLDGAGVRLVDAPQDLDQRGFASAVFAEQCVDLTGPQIEVHALQRLDTAK